MIQLVPISEIARQARVCAATAVRRTKAAGVEPDALLVCGMRKPPSPLYLAKRIPAITKLIDTTPDNIATETEGN